MPNPEPTARSPLAAIREKEHVLEKQILVAQERSSAAIAQARAQADAIKQQAEREGLRDAEAIYQKGLVSAREQAAAIAQEGEKQAKLQQEAGAQRIPQAIDHIVAYVLPRIE